MMVKRNLLFMLLSVFIIAISFFSNNSYSQQQTLFTSSNNSSLSIEQQEILDNTLNSTRGGLVNIVTIQTNNVSEFENRLLTGSSDVVPLTSSDLEDSHAGMVLGAASVETINEGTENESTSFTGVVTDDPNFLESAVAGDVSPTTSFTIQGDNAVGRIIEGNKILSLRPLGGGAHAIIEIQQDALPPEHPETFEEIRDQDKALDDQSSLEDLPEGDAIVSILVAYSKDVTLKHPLTDLFIQEAINQTNRSFNNSGVNLKLDLVQTHALENEKFTSIDKALDALETKYDENLEELHEIRDKLSIDVIGLIVSNRDSCGKAAEIGPDKAEKGFVVVSDACAVDNLSFAHEIGHILAARHDLINDPNTTPYPDAHGISFPDENCRTVMAYPCSGGISCPRVENFSSPLVKICDDHVGGTKEFENNARVLNVWKNKVANFR